MDAVCWFSDDVVAATGAAGQLHLWDLAEPSDDGSPVRPPTCSIPGNAGELVPRSCLYVR